MKDPARLKIFAIIPSGFCFGLQHITVDFFSRFPASVLSHFLLTRWTNGEMEASLKKHSIPYSFSWLGMFSRKMDGANIKMSLHALIKLPVLYFDFLRVNRRFDPDILFFANHHELILLYPLLLLTKRKVVCHMHDPAPAIAFQKKTFKKYNKVVDHYIAVSENVRQRTIELGCAPGKITTIHNGIAIPDEIRQRDNGFCSKAGWPIDSFIIGITGQMTEKKGHLDLLSAFKEVYQVNHNARLAIGGKMQEPMYSMLQNEISKSGLEQVVHFTGWLPEIKLFFNSIDVFVLASRHDEGYGLVVAEALVNSIPVVITNSGGAVEIVENGVNGFIVPKHDPVAMAKRLIQLSENPELRRQFGISGRERVEEFFNIDKQAAALVSHLQMIKVKDVRES